MSVTATSCPHLGIVLRDDLSVVGDEFRNVLRCVVEYILQLAQEPFEEVVLTVSTSIGIDCFGFADSRSLLQHQRASGLQLGFYDGQDCFHDATNSLCVNAILHLSGMNRRCQPLTETH